MSPAKKATVTVRLLFADGGSYESVDVGVPRASIDAYERLIDCLLEDPEVLRLVHVDVDRLCAAHVVED